MCEIMERLANEAKEEGVAHVNALNSILIDLNRFDNLKRAATDKDFQMQLMIELLPDDMFFLQNIFQESFYSFPYTLPLYASI